MRLLTFACTPLCNKRSFWSTRNTHVSTGSWLIRRNSSLEIFKNLKSIYHEVGLRVRSDCRNRNLQHNEATLIRVLMPFHTRSRKAKIILGLFKEEVGAGPEVSPFDFLYAIRPSVSSLADHKYIREKKNEKKRRIFCYRFVPPTFLHFLIPMRYEWITYKNCTPRTRIPNTNLFFNTFLRWFLPGYLRDWKV